MAVLVMPFQRISVVWFALLLSACQHPPAPAVFDYAAGMGITVQKTGGICLDIGNSNLKPGAKVQFVNSSMPQTTGEVEVTGTGTEACTAAEQSKAHYQVKVVRGALKKAAPAFALDFGGTIRESETGASADLEGDGKAVTFRACTWNQGCNR